MSDLLAKALTGDKWSTGRLISLFEDSRTQQAAERERVIEELERNKGSRRAYFLGLTGTPGAGKSSLVGEIANRLIRRDDQLRVAVLAVDPSSHVSRGAILGDRTRVHFPIDERRLFFRSQASDLELGGVSRTTFQVCRLLYFLFDFVFIETVGIGQSEIEIQYIADRIYLVLQPLGGDGIQFMKAGIMEIPDVFLINKSDEADAANRSYHALRASLAFARPGEEKKIPIMKTSAKTGLGLDELVDDICDIDRAAARHSMHEKEVFFFDRWVRDEYGRAGLRLLSMLGQSFLRDAGGFDRAQGDFATKFEAAFPVTGEKA